MRIHFKKFTFFIAVTAFTTIAFCKSNDEGCDDRRLALATFVTSCAAWKGIYQANRGDTFAKQKSDCREISKEFSKIIFGVAPKSCEFTYAPNLIRALMQDKDIRAFADSL